MSILDISNNNIDIAFFMFILLYECYCFIAIGIVKSIVSVCIIQ